MHPFEAVPEAYRIQFSLDAAPQAARLSGAARERLNRKLLDLADLASFAAGYAITVSRIEWLMADVGGVSVKYRVDDGARLVTVLEIAAEPSAP